MVREAERAQIQLLAGLLEAVPAPQALVGAEPGLPVLAANAELGRLLGGQPMEGRPLGELLGDDVERLLRPVRERATRVHGEPIDPSSLAGQVLAGWSRPPEPRWRLSAHPLTTPDGAVVAVVVTLADLSGATAQGAEDAAIVRELVELLPRLGSVAQAARLAADGLVRVVGVDRAALLIDDTGSGRFRPVGATHEADLDDEIDLTGEAAPLWQLLLQQARMRWSAFEADRPPPVPFGGSPGWRELGLAPLTMHEPSAKGLVVVGVDEPGALDHAALERLGFAASLASVMVASAGMSQRLQETRLVCRGAVETAAELVEADALGDERTRLVRGLVERLGSFDGAALWEVVEGGEVALVADHGLPRELLGRLGRLPAASRVAQLARGAHVTGPDGTVHLQRSTWPGRSLMLVPLPGPHPAVLGCYHAERLGPSAPQAEVLRALARAVAAVRRRTRRHDVAREVVASLQRELRPSLPAHHGHRIDAGARYVAATAGLELCGDFYDLLPVEGAEIEVVCGDVVGHGASAVSLTTMVLHAIRAYSKAAQAPEATVRMLNELVCERVGAERFLTLASVRVPADCWEVDLVLAGHPRPLHVGPNGAVPVAADPGLPVGVDPGADYRSRTLALGPGEALVVYTDGVTEARAGGMRRGELLGEQRLTERLAALHGRSAQRMADGVWESVRAWAGEEVTDDCAVVVLRRPASSAA